MAARTFTQRVDHWLEGYLPENIAEWVYGAVVTAAAIAVISSHDVDGRGVLVAAVGTLFVYYLVHVYIRVIADRIADPHSGLRERLGEALRHEVAVLQGGGPAVLAYVIGWSVLGHEWAGQVALWSTVLVLGAMGYLVARKVGATGVRMVLEILGAAAFGLMAVLLNSILH